MKIFQFWVILYFCNIFAYSKCVGHIDTLIPEGILIKIKNDLDDKLCWTNAIDYVYRLRESENNLFMKLLPPTGKIFGENKDDWWLVEFHRVRAIRNEDYIILKWNNMQKTSNHKDFRDENFYSIDKIKKGQSIIIDVPCLDEKKAKKNTPFHITKTNIPTIQCEIAPADKDYFKK